MTPLLVRLARADIERAGEWANVLERAIPELVDRPDLLKGVVLLKSYGNPDPRGGAAFLVGDADTFVIVDGRPDLFPVLSSHLYTGDVRVISINSHKWRRFRMAEGRGTPSVLASGQVDIATPADYEASWSVAGPMTLEQVAARVEAEKLRLEEERRAEQLRAEEERRAEQLRAEEERRAEYLRLDAEQVRLAEEARAEWRRLEEDELKRRKALQGRLPAARLVKTAAAAEAYAAEVMRALGYTDAELTPPGPDGGIDVVARDAVAQVKMEALATSAPAVQALFGVASADAKQAFFFSLAGFTEKAIEFAERAGVACFEYAFDGSVEGANGVAKELMRRRLRPEQ